MMRGQIDAEALAGEGIAALRRGNPAQARRHFEALIEASVPGFPPPWFLLAQACHQLGDDAGEEAALDRHLAVDTRHLASLLMLGDLKVRTGDTRAASACYATARNVATARPDQVRGQLPAMLDRAAAWQAEQDRLYAARLLDTVAGLPDGPAGARVRQAIDLLLGRTQLYLQQPSMFYFPGLPQRQYYERDEFAWLPGLEAAAPDIRAELLALMREDAPSFMPYVEAVPGRPRPANPLLDDRSWSASYLWRGGALVEENATRCPATVAALEQVPIPRIAGRSPMALFSMLRPHTRIQPHHGMLNTRLICHLPLLVPGDCALRVGNETRAWREGEAVIFDDSIEHEAWNESDSIRVVLLFEIWRPELTLDERAALTRILETVSGYEDGN
ncbi:aspartyl/asparaginyl beta-hydroxylase domain-containing protein [Sphingomonas sp. ZT3P38]|uniref:aspartyl/asparaginyl beta-hydroxylase domain-containing protein n=1 Tax=Parasphingomonas zepuensis TaxID=3096161 RepID=UPI002FC9B374